MDYLSNSPEETQQIAQDLVTSLKGGEFIELVGDLGAGKTTFAQGMGKALGVKRPLRSPTFTIMNIYKTDHRAIKRIVHIDCYRLQETCDLHTLELEEWLGKPDTIILTEWPIENMASGTKTIQVKLEQKSESVRAIIIKKKSSK
jgi:tRNA threonylcarbamoyladenosine biosynthesis protein TsaE